MASLSPCSRSGELPPLSLYIGSPVSPSLTPLPQSVVRPESTSTFVSYSGAATTPHCASRKTTVPKSRLDVEEKISVIEEQPTCPDVRQPSVDPDYHLPEVVTEKRIFDHNDEWDAPACRRLADLKACIPYTNTKRHIKGLQFRYVCRVPGCPDAYDTPSKEKRHFKDIHVFAHVCTICADRFQKPKQLWRHLLRKHRLNIPAEPKLLSETLGCPCCCKAATERVANDNRFLGKAASPAISQRNSEAVNSQTSAVSKSSKRGKHKIFDFDMRPRRKVLFDDHKQMQGEDQSPQDDNISTDYEYPRRGEGYLEVTTDLFGFKGVHINGMETPYALTQKIVAAMGLGVHDFPNLITIRTWTPRDGVTKALYDFQDVWTAVHNAIDDKGSLKLYLSTFFSLAKRPEDESLSDQSTVVADSQATLWSVRSRSDRSGPCQFETLLKGGNTADATQTSTSEQPSVVSHKQLSGDTSRKASAETSMIAQDSQDVLQRHGTGSSHASTLTKQLSFKCSNILKASGKRSVTSKTDDLTPAAISNEAEVTIESIGTIREARPAEKICAPNNVDRIVTSTRPDTLPLGPTEKCPTIKASVADGEAFRPSRQLPRTSQQAILRAGCIPEWLETLPVPRIASRLCSETVQLEISRVLDQLRSSCKADISAEARRPVVHLDTGRSGTTSLKSRLRSAFSRVHALSLVAKDQSDSSEDFLSHQEISDTTSEPTSEVTDAPPETKPQEHVATLGAQNHSAGPPHHEQSASRSGQPSSSSLAHSSPPPLSAPRGRELPSDGEDDGQRLNPKRPRLETSTISCKLRFPCIYLAGEPEAYSDHQTRFQYISHLERHLRSSHGFFVCCKCFSVFLTEKQQTDHLDKTNPGCFKACQSKSCRKFWLKNSGAAPTECDCIRSSKKQWERLFRLRYPDQSTTNVFASQALNAGLQQITPVTPTSHSLPSALEPDQDNDLQTKPDTPPIGGLPGSQQGEVIPGLPQAGFHDLFDFDAFLAAQSQTAVDPGAIGSASTWQESKRLHEKNKELETKLKTLTWKSCQPDPRSEKLEQMLGKVWQALVDTKSPSADPFSPLWSSMKELAPNIVQLSVPGLPAVSATNFTNSSSNTLGSSNFSSWPS